MPGYAAVNAAFANAERKLASRFTPLVTLFTDAGFCEYTKAAVWAAWAKHDGVTIRRSGILRGEYRGSHYAEAAAIANGVACVVREFPNIRGARVIVQSDNQCALAVVGGKVRRPKARKRNADVIRAVAMLVSRHALTLDCRYVPAHKGTADARQAVNTWCDLECRRLLREARALVGRSGQPLPVARVGQEGQPAGTA